jgi:hypothetical protein
MHDRRVGGRYGFENAAYVRDHEEVGELEAAHHKSMVPVYRLAAEQRQRVMNDGGAKAMRKNGCLHDVAARHTGSDGLHQGSAEPQAHLGTHLADEAI